MDKEKISNKKIKEGEDMQATLQKESTDLKISLKKIGAKIPFLGGPKGKIKLDPQNEEHKDWYEDDGEK